MLSLAILADRRPIGLGLIQSRGVPWRCFAARVRVGGPAVPGDPTPCCGTKALHLPVTDDGAVEDPPWRGSSGLVARFDIAASLAEMR